MAKVETEIKSAQAELSNVNTSQTTEEMLITQSKGISLLGDAIISQRKMIGALTGIALSAVLLGERNDKQMIKLMRGKR